MLPMLLAPRWIIFVRRIIGVLGLLIPVAYFIGRLYLPYPARQISILLCLTTIVAIPRGFLCLMTCFYMAGGIYAKHTPRGGFGLSVIYIILSGLSGFPQEYSVHDWIELLNIFGFSLIVLIDVILTSIYYAVSVIRTGKSSWYVVIFQ